MALPHIVRASGGTKRPAWIRTVRVMMGSPAMKATRAVVGTLVLLVLLGVAIGQLLGHLLAAGIENLLDVFIVDQTG